MQYAVYNDATGKLPLPRPVRMQQSRVLVAGPTAGKSTAQRSLAVRGCVVLDSDDVIKECFPMWFEDRLWSKPPPKGTDHRQRDLETQLGRYAAQWLNDVPHGLFFTNMWGPALAAALGDVYAPGGKFPLGVFRMSASEISAISKAREPNSSGIPEKLAAKWVSSWSALALSMCNAVIWLHPPQKEERSSFLMDVVQFSYAWVLPYPRPFTLSANAV